MATSIHHRLQAIDLNLPFLASRADSHSCFQYQLQEIALDGLTIAIPDWLVNRDHLAVGDAINFHLPFKRGDALRDSGKIISAIWDDQLRAQICRATLETACSYGDRIFVRLETNEVEFGSVDKDFLTRLLRDSMLLKRGVLIYWEHLIPFFSRVARYPAKDYAKLKETVLLDVSRRISANLKEMEKLLATVIAADFRHESMAGLIDLEHTRSIVESEISSELFEQTFPASSARAYIDSIKNLEARLYLSYNLLVLMYARDL